MSRPDLTTGRSDALRVVLDTNVLLSLFVFDDSRYAAIGRAMEEGRWCPLTDERCLAEFRRVLAYPMFDLDHAAQAAAAAAYERFAARVTAPPSGQAPLPQCRDRDDQKFLELARDGGAALLVTSDKALLKLARRGRLRSFFRIVTPEAALALIGAGDSVIVGTGEPSTSAHGDLRGHP